MYQCNLILQIFSKDALLIAAIKKQTPQERFSHTIQVYEEFPTDLSPIGDIIILDQPSLHNISDIRAICGESAILILCQTQEQNLTMTETMYAGIADLWVKPFTPAYISFRFQQILSRLKLNKDYHLYQSYLDTAMNSIPDLIWFKDLRGAHLKVNNAFCNAVGKKKEDIEGRGHYYIWDMKKEEYEQGEYICLESEDIVIQAQKTCCFDEKVKSKHGMRQFKTYKSPLFDDNGEIMGTVGIAHDMTDLENIDAELEIILRSMPFAILIKNDTDCIINTNNKFEEYFNEKRANIIGKNYSVWKSNTLEILPQSDNDDFEEAKLSASDNPRILQIQEKVIFDVFHNPVGHICIYRDITRERILENQILHTANTDFLTGLYNRRFFYKYVNEHRRDQQISLLSVDLDNFKKVNDTFGHQIGDNALVTAANSIKESFPNDLTARIGGDEFLIAFFGEHTHQSLDDKANLLLHKMWHVFQQCKKYEIMSASIGIASTNDPNLEIDELIKWSDIALYEAKQLGKAQYCFYQPKKLQS